MAAAAAWAAIRAAAATAVAFASADRIAVSMGTAPSNCLSEPLAAAFFPGLMVFHSFSICYCLSAARALSFPVAAAESVSVSSVVTPLALKSTGSTFCSIRRGRRVKSFPVPLYVVPLYVYPGYITLPIHP